MSRHAQPRLRIPETIRLPDGRIISVRELVTGPRNRRSYNLRTGMEFGQRIKRKITKDVDKPRE